MIDYVPSEKDFSDVKIENTSGNPRFFEGNAWVEYLQASVWQFLE